MISEVKPMTFTSTLAGKLGFKSHIDAAGLIVWTRPGLNGTYIEVYQEDLSSYAVAVERGDNERVVIAPGLSRDNAFRIAAAYIQIHHESVALYGK